jgi:hypothetical protein
MRYLYGDSSSFPLNQNFLDTLAHATDCCVALLQVDENIHKAHKVADQANAASLKELADIEQLLQRVEKALSQRDHLSNATAKVVEQVAATAKGQFDRARDGIQAWRDGTIRKAQQGCGPSDIMAPLHRFLVKHELPYTSWGLRWKSGRAEEPVQAQVYAIMQRGLTATLSVAIPARHLWAQPVRVGQLEPRFTIQLMGKNWLGKDKMVDEHLDKYFIVRVTRTSERHQVILSKKAKEPSEMMRLSLREGEVKRVTVQRIDDDENPLSEAATLEGMDAQLAKRLWRQIEETICDLVHYRAQLLAATIYNKRVTEVESPATIAVAIIQSISPLVRDLKRHSRSPGELQLKRDLGDGRREELFIPEREVTGKYAVLSPKNQQLFDSYGLTTTHVPEARASEPAPQSIAYEPAPPPSAPASVPAPAQSQPAHASGRRDETTDFIPPAPPVPADLTAQVQAQAPPSAPAPQPYFPTADAFPSEAPPAMGGSPIPSRPPTRPPARPQLKTVPSSIPPPSHPPRRRQVPSSPQSTGPGSQAPGSSPPVFNLPAPSKPPPKRRGRDPKAQGSRRAANE